MLVALNNTFIDTLLRHEAGDKIFIRVINYLVEYFQCDKIHSTISSGEEGEYCGV